MTAAMATIRRATPADAPLIWPLLLELARYEKLEHEVSGSPEALALALAGDPPATNGFIAESGGRAVGYALYFAEFSSFATAPLLWLEDLYVAPDFRGSGLGADLLRVIAREAVARGCARLAWEVLDWNEPAIGFYRRMGAVAAAGWRTFGVAGASLQALAETSATTS